MSSSLSIFLTCLSHALYHYYTQLSFHQQKCQMQENKKNSKNCCLSVFELWFKGQSNSEKNPPPVFFHSVTILMDVCVHLHIQTLTSKHA